MIANVEPVAHVHAVPIDGDGFAAQDALNDDGDELFGELIRAVVVRAVRDECRQPVGVIVGTNKQVACGLASGVGRVRRVGRGLGEESFRAERTEDFIRADVQESVRGSRFAVHGLPGIAASLEEMEGAVDVGGDEVAGASDATIDMAFGSEVHDMRDFMLTDDAKDFVLIPQIDFFEHVTRMNAMDAIKVFKMPRVGEAVEIDELCNFRLVNDESDEV